MNCDKIIGCVLRNLANNRYKDLRVKEPLWTKVAEMCGLGSTSAYELCRRFKLDPYTGERLDAKN